MARAINSKQSYFHQYLKEDKNDPPKKIWAVIRDLASSKTCKQNAPLPLHSAADQSTIIKPQNTAEISNDYFINVAKN